MVNYIAILTDIEPKVFEDKRKKQEELEIAGIIEFEERPTPLDILKICYEEDIQQDWKIIYKVQELPGEEVEIIEHVTSFGPLIMSEGFMKN